MSFTHPWLVVVGVAMAILAGAGVVRRARRGRRLLAALGGGSAIRRLSHRGLFRVRGERILLMGLASLALATALAGPRFEEHEEGEALPTDRPSSPRVMLAIDVSGSMQADDASSSRLGAAVDVAGQVLESLHEATVGLLLFAGETYLLSPPTHDHRTVAYMLGGVTPTTISPWDSGSRMSSGIREAAAYLRMEEDDGPGGPAIVIVVSDGALEEADGEVMAAVRDAVTSGVTVHAVGVGMELGGPEESLLRQIAQVGRGAYGHGALPRGLVVRLGVLPVDVVSETSLSDWPARDVPLGLAFLALVLLVTDGLLDARMRWSQRIRKRELG